jgi:hypothetical protein
VALNCCTNPAFYSVIARSVSDVAISVAFGKDPEIATPFSGRTRNDRYY